jgi:lysine decarboxylase
VLLDETLGALAEARDAVREIPGLDVLDERLTGAPGVFGYDPLRLVVDVRGTGHGGYEIAHRLIELDDVNLELAGQNVVVAVFGMGEPARPAVARLLAGLRHVVDELPPAVPSGLGFAPPPPWGELVMSPREAFLGPQQVVPADEAAGRVAAESLAAYPPGIPNVLPGERMTVETIQYVRRALDLGGSLRGASDRKLRTVRVAVE